MHVDALISAYGLPAILLGAAVEGESTVVAGGILAHRHLFSPLAVMAAAFMGSFCMDQLLFTLGRRYRNRPFVQRIMARSLAVRASAALDRHPTAYVLGFRFLIGVRTISPVAIGASGMRCRLFIPLNMLSVLLWSGLFTAIGYYVSGRVSAILRYVPHDVPWLAALLLLVVGVALLFHRRSASRATAEHVGS